jgi:hypothetical protein
MKTRRKGGNYFSNIKQNMLSRASENKFLYFASEKSDINIQLYPTLSLINTNVLFTSAFRSPTASIKEVTKLPLIIDISLPKVQEVDRVDVMLIYFSLSNEVDVIHSTPIDYKHQTILQTLFGQITKTNTTINDIAELIHYNTPHMRSRSWSIALATKLSKYTDFWKAPLENRLKIYSAEYNSDDPINYLIQEKSVPSKLLPYRKNVMTRHSSVDINIDTIKNKVLKPEHLSKVFFFPNSGYDMNVVTRDGKVMINPDSQPVISNTITTEVSLKSFINRPAILYCSTLHKPERDGHAILCIYFPGQDTVDVMNTRVSDLEDMSALTIAFETSTKTSLQVNDIASLIGPTDDGYPYDLQEFEPPETGWCAGWMVSFSQRLVALGPEFWGTTLASQRVPFYKNIYEQAKKTCIQTTWNDLRRRGGKKTYRRKRHLNINGVRR